MYDGVVKAREMSNTVDEALFKELEARMEKNDYSIGRPHPINVLFNIKEDIIEGYDLIVKLHRERSKCREKMEEINKILGDE